MKENDFESQINHLVQHHIPTKDKYSRSKEKTSRGHNYSQPFKDNDRNMNNFYQETNESYVKYYFILKIKLTISWIRALKVV